MQELAQGTKKKTSPHRHNISKKDSRRTNSSKTMEADSTSKGKDLTPYWTESCLETSKRWLSLTETGCADLVLNSSSESQTRTIAESWFSTRVASPHKKNSSETLFQSSMSSPVVFTDSENTVVRSRKIRIYPKQNKQMNKWFGLSRYWFNKAVDYLKKPETKASLSEVRKVIQVSSNHPEWTFDCPQRIRDHAMADACKAVKNAKQKYKAGEGFQDVGFRSRKDPKQVFGFDAQSLHENFVFSQKGFKSVYHATEPIEAEMEGTRIVKENGRYFVVVPREVPVKVPENQRLSQVAIDPGVRTFVAFFSPELNGEIGNGDFNKIMRLCFGLDKLMSKVAKAKCKLKRNMKKASQRLRWKIKDLISDLHHKVARFIVNTFDTIYLPSFKTSQMVTKLVSKTARMMQTFSHYSFQQFLIAKAEEYSSKVVLCNEAYTSKTCSYCGKIHKIGGKKVMKCECGIEVSRDYNGARGILLRALAVTPPLETVGNC